MGEIITIVSAKGGTGKTTITANVGAAMADEGYKVLMVDGDAGVSGLDMTTGLSGRVVYSVHDILEGSCTIAAALVKIPDYDMFYMLPASRVRGLSSISNEQFLRLMKIFRNQFDYVLIDAPAGLGDGFKKAVLPADRVLIVSEPNLLSLRAAARTDSVLKNMRPGRKGLILNRVRMDLIKDGEVMTPTQAANKVSIPLIGVIPDDDDVLINGEEGVFSYTLPSVAGRAFGNIARRIRGERVPIVLKRRR